MSQVKLYKILLVGDENVGKSSILSRFTQNTFNDDYVATIGIDFATRNETFFGEEVKLQIWDTAGQERFKTITKSYYRGAHGVVLVFDTTNVESFKKLPTYIKDLQNEITCPILLCANKSDLDSQIDPNLITELVQDFGLNITYVSAKENLNLDSLFSMMIQQIQRVQDEIQNQQAQVNILTWKKKLLVSQNELLEQYKPGDIKPETDEKEKIKAVFKSSLQSKTAAEFSPQIVKVIKLLQQEREKFHDEPKDLKAILVELSALKVSLKKGQTNVQGKSPENQLIGAIEHFEEILEASQNSQKMEFLLRLQSQEQIEKLQNLL